jgi:hypothetical protein
MSVHYEVDRRRFVVRWREDGRQRSKRSRTEHEAVEFDAGIGEPEPANEPPAATVAVGDGVYAYATRDGVRFRFLFPQSDGPLSSRRGFRVSQLVRRANDHIREALHELEAAEVSLPPRAKPLHELETLAAAVAHAGDRPAPAQSRRARGLRHAVARLAPCGVGDRGLPAAHRIRLRDARARATTPTRRIRQGLRRGTESDRPCLPTTVVRSRTRRLRGQSSRRCHRRRVTFEQLRPVMHRGELVALAGRRRFSPPRAVARRPTGRPRIQTFDSSRCSASTTARS